MLANLLWGPCMREAGIPVFSDARLRAGCRSVHAAEADCDALDLAYLLLNVHMHLLVVVVDSPRTASRARVVCDGSG